MPSGNFDVCVLDLLVSKMFELIQQCFNICENETDMSYIPKKNGYKVIDIAFSFFYCKSIIYNLDFLDRFDIIK